jgi:hypothetical protein
MSCRVARSRYRYDDRRHPRHPIQRSRRTLNALADVYRAKYGDDWDFAVDDEVFNPAGVTAHVFRVTPSKVLAFAVDQVSHREQALEELAITLQGDTKILGRGLLAASPLLLESRTRLSEAAGELFDDIGDEAVGFLNALAGIVDETGLHVVPACTESGQMVVGEELLPG